MNKIRGIAASPGIAFGPVFQYEPPEFEFKRQAASDPGTEWKRLQAALKTAEEQLLELRKGIEDKESAEIFKSQAMMLSDPELERRLREGIETNRHSAEFAVQTSMEHYAAQLEGLESELLSARAADVRDVKRRVLRILLGVEQAGWAALDMPSIIVAEDLAPSDTAALPKDLALALCTAEGGSTSHTAILARSLRIPAVVGAGSIILELKTGTPAALDGEAGLLVVEPDADTTASLEARKAERERDLVDAQKLAHEPAVTRDGKMIPILANVRDLADAESATKLGAEGIGLLRTEFLFLDRESMPTEEEQFQAYRDILHIFGDRPVILRTLDIGGDKPLPYLELPPESNPFLGVRGSRLALNRPELLRPQLRAALRAGAGYGLKLMFPFIADVGELQSMLDELEACKVELSESAVEFAQDIEVGIMVEIPSAALVADRLIQWVDFFSLGTNDLSQYALAADRTNAAVAPLASGAHPAVLRLIDGVVRAAHQAGKWVGICGELAGDPLAIPLLLGLGLDELSMSGDRIATAKELIRSGETSIARDLARRALELDSIEQVLELVRSSFNKR